MRATRLPSKALPISKRSQPRAIDKKTRILQAARSVVAEGGFRELQMNAVANAAGVAVGTIYRYYPSRAELCAAVVSIISQREVEVLAEVATADGAPSDKLRDAVRTFAARAIRGRRLAYALIAEPIDPEVESTRLDYRRAIGRVFEAILHEGIASGEFRAAQDVEVSVACLVGAFMEGLVGPLAPDARGIETRANEIAESISVLCLAAVSTPPALQPLLKTTTKRVTGPPPRSHSASKVKKARPSSRKPSRKSR
ncbi:MAG: TetR/AcrR family transcriptional regulator [Burkholderiaceae bacterium]